MTDGPVRIALVGLGQIARSEHIPAIRGNGDFTLVATVDPNAQGIEAVPHFGTAGEMLRNLRGELDAVAICTPPGTHFEIATEALRSGLHVVLEKPPATSLAECEALENLARDARTTLFAAWHSRFARSFEPARRWLAAKQIRRVSITWEEAVEKWHPGQAWIWQEGGFGVFDAGINALSIATYILPQGLALRSSTLTVPEGLAMPVAAQLRFVSGQSPVEASFDWRRTGPEVWEIIVVTDSGELSLTLGGAALQIGDSIEDAESHEYASLYAYFRNLIAEGRIDFDLEPLALVIDSLRSGERVAVAWEIG